MRSSHRASEPTGSRACAALASVLGFITATCLIATAALGATRRVPDEYSTIQAGINAATHGDTVLVAPGTYAGTGNRDIRFNGKRIVVRSEAGAEATIVDCQGTEIDPHRGFDFYNTGETHESILQGFTITNGYAVYTDNDPNTRYGGGIRIYGYNGTAHPIVQDCIITSCNACSGSAVFCSDDSIIRRCSFMGNVGCTTVDLRSAAHIEDCVISGNYGSGIEASSRSRVIATHIVGNEGDGIRMDVADNVVVRDCTIVGNTGVGIGMIYSYDILVQGCTIAANRNNLEGLGGLWLLYSSPVTLRNSIVRANCYTDIWLSSTSGLTVECSAIDPSRVENYGDLVYSGTQVTSDPLFCAEAPCMDAPTTEGDYHLQEDSPCLPESSPCGELIGALGECEASSVPGESVPLPAASPTSALRIGIAPHPAKAGGLVQLQLARADGRAALPADGDLLEVCVFDVSGRERLRSTPPTTGDRLNLELRNLEPGAYFIRVRAGDAYGAARLLVVP